MAIYHFSAKVISRGAGSSAVAAAAYRSGSRLHDVRLGRDHDFGAKRDVVHSEVLLPDGAPERWDDREALWNDVEAAEKRCDAQLAREVEFAIPRELTQEQGIALARDYVQREFVDRGMVADLNVHWDRAEDGSPKPHAHVMLTMREVGAEGPDGEVRFGKKVREWNATAELQGWRERWADHVNARLVELGIDAAIDHRSLREQGIGLEPQHKIGPAGARREERGEDAERAAEHRAIARRNGERLIAEPQVALEALTRQRSTFTERDLQGLVFRHTDGVEQYRAALSAVQASPEIVCLGQDGRGCDRFSTREMIGVERGLEAAAERRAQGRDHGVSARSLEAAERRARERGLVLGEEQRGALAHVTGDRDLGLVVGYAGSGKSAMLGVAREAWEAEGYAVRGAALSGIAAESLEAGSAIPSRTIASLEHAWGQGREELTSRDVLVIDEAGMVGSRQLARVMEHAERAGAKLVLVGDPEQLQAIEAGAAFRALRDRHGAVEITEVRRQREDWQRDATRELATGCTGEALDRYEAAGMVHTHDSHARALEAVVEGWDAQRQAQPDQNRVILAHTRADVAELNRLARDRLREAAELGEEVAIATGRGERTFASGDRVMFLRNERSLGVKNGTLGTVEEISPSHLEVRLDDGRRVGVEVRDYADLDHGYASTIHKAQGVTVDRAHVLATPGLDRHAAYVALTRHRDGVELHYGQDQFADRAALAATLGRERAKDTTLDYRLVDYTRTFAERRGIEVPFELQRETVRQVAREAPGRKRSMFEGLKLGAAAPTREVAPPLEAASLDPQAEQRAQLRRSVRTYALAWADMERMGEQGLPVLPHQKLALRQAHDGVEKLAPEVGSDVRRALDRNPGLARKAETEPGFREVLQAVRTEREVRLNPELRADRFVEEWTSLKARRDRMDWYGRDRIDELMSEMARDLQRDPQLDSVLRNRRLQLQLEKQIEGPSMPFHEELTRSLRLGRSLGIGL